MSLGNKVKETSIVHKMLYSTIFWKGSLGPELVMMAAKMQLRNRL